MSRRNVQFSSIRTEGGLLPQDVLSRIQAGDKNLSGLTPESYHLGPHERIGEAVNRAWSRLTAAWRAFQEALAKEPDAAKATGLTRDRWLLPLFQELGYGRLPKGQAIEVEGKSYAVSHMSPWSPVHLLGVGVDLDRRQAGVSGAAKASPHGLVQEFLNRSEKYLWGFVSNGLHLRVLRDHHSLTRQAYVEFDLQALMEGEQYSDFLLLWMVCHQSRVEADKPADCWLERWFNTSRDEGVQALDKLRGGVEKAIESFGTGFLAQRANTKLRNALENGELDKQEYYRQVLRLVYRVIFLFVAEERDALLDPEAEDNAKSRYLRFYATRRLRELSDRRRGSPHGDLWQGLCLVMSKLDDGCPELALPALGSRLWGATACPALMDAECSNEHLLEAVRQISNIEEGRTRYPVNWRNVGADELGSIYESLLELHPRINKDAATFVLETAAGHERKKTGSYYTPTELVDCLLDSALDPVLDVACKKPDREAAILDLKVCDPACGSGHFLVAAARRIAKRLAAVRAGEDEPSPREVQRALRDVVGRCIYGVDVNPMAVELCKVSLWMEAIEPGRPLSFLDSHIQCGNALLGATPALMGRGIPDDAFKPIERDDKNVAKRLKKRNKDEREGQTTMFVLFAGGSSGDHATVAAQAATIDAEPDTDISAVRRKSDDWERFTRSAEFKDAWFKADAWCAALLWPKQPGDLEDSAITEGAWRRILRDPSDAAVVTRRTVRELARQHRFFHWHLSFPQVFRPERDGSRGGMPWSGWTGGFDTILGNPPWIRQEEFVDIKPILATYDAFKSSADLSVFFLELATRTCRIDGTAGILTPNKWFRADYGLNLRKILRERVRVLLLVDFGHSKTLFPAADTFPAAISFQIVANSVDAETELLALDAPDAVRRQQPLAILLREAVRRVPHSHLREAIWQLQDAATVNFLERLQRTCRPLQKIAGPPLFGIKTGLNAAYCIDDATRRRLIGSDPASEEVIKPFARGREIGRWACYANAQWILVLASSVNRAWPWSRANDEVAAEQLFADTYPAIYEHLKQHEQALRARSDQGTFWWELRSCDYYAAFTRPKIIVGDMAWRAEFAFDPGELHVGNTIYVVPTDDFYVLGVLNSRLMWWYFYNTAQPAKDDARRFMGVLGELPIPTEVDPEVKAEIANCVASLVNLKQESPDDAKGQLDLEHQLNELVEQAFQLSPSERQVLLDTLAPRDPIALLEAAVAEVGLAPVEEADFRPVTTFVVPDFAALTDATWATPHGVEDANVALFSLIEVLRAVDGAVDAERVRLAALLVRKPALALPFMDPSTKREWARLVGHEARPLPDNVIPLSRFQKNAVDRGWGDAVKQLKASRALVEDSDAGTWTAGPTLPASGQEWIAGRAEIAVRLLAKLEVAQAEQNLVAFVKEVERVAASSAVS